MEAGPVASLVAPFLKSSIPPFLRECPPRTGHFFVNSAPLLIGFRQFALRDFNLQFDLRGSGEMRFSVGPKENELSIGSLRTLIEIFALQDCAAEKLGVCANPDCPARFFLKVRRGQNFCSHRCAVLINVRRFREREKRQTKRRIKR